MDTDTDTIYSTPEKFGMTLVGAVNASEGSPYGYDLFCVWDDGRGLLHYDFDSGNKRMVPFKGQTQASIALASDVWDVINELHDWLHDERWDRDADGKDLELVATLCKWDAERRERQKKS